MQGPGPHPPVGLACARGRRRGPAGRLRAAALLVLCALVLLGAGLHGPAGAGGVARPPGLLPAPAGGARPTRVSLAAQQTPLRSQGARGTCSAFGAVAGLEAALKRKGLGEWDLSEEFLAYAGKLMWIDVQWTRVARRGTDVPENMHAASTGSTGTFLVEMLGGGFAVPTEQDLPYRTSYAGQLGGHEDLRDPWWQVAWNVDLWNLDPARLPRQALSAPAYHRVSDYRWIYLGRREDDPTYAERFEEVLAAGREIVWDVGVRNGPASDRDGIWHHDPARPPQEAHAMLVVGYDRSDPDPQQHHFLVKNSWGPTSHPDGLTRVGYDYLRHGMGALFIEDVAAPGPWPAAAFVGRWHVSLDGKPAVLAWNRVPGVLQRGLEQSRALHPEEPAMVDRRVGNLYPQATPRPVLRVNGAVHGERSASVWFDPYTPALRYDATSGRRIDLQLLGPARDAFVGTYAEEGGRRARCHGALGGRLGRPGTPREAAALEGAWRLWVGEAEGVLDLGQGGGAGAPAQLVLEAFGLSRTVQARPAVDDPRVLVVMTELPQGGTLSIRLAAVPHEEGVLVGEAYAPNPAGGALRTLGALAARQP